MSAGRARARSRSRLAAAALVGLVACATHPPSATGDDASPERPSALCGLWSDTQTWLRLGGDGRFRWEEPTPCEVPPCPWQITEGRWRATDGLLWLERGDGRGTHTLTWNLTHTPRTLTLEGRRGPGWVLAFREP